MIKRMHDLVPTMRTGLIRAKTSTNSTIARKTSAPKPGTTRDKRPSNRSTSSAPKVHTEIASLCNNDAFPMIRAGVPRPRRLPDVHLLEAEHGIRRGQRTSTAHSTSSASLNTKRCTAAITGCQMRAGTPIAFWKSEGDQALQAHSGIGPCAARARVGRHCGGGVIQLAFIRGGKGTEGCLWRDGRQGAHVPSTPAKN